MKWDVISAEVSYKSAEGTNHVQIFVEEGFRGSEDQFCIHVASEWKKRASLVVLQRDRVSGDEVTLPSAKRTSSTDEPESTGRVAFSLQPLRFRACNFLDLHFERN